MAGESERALIERLRQGDSAAFDALYDLGVWLLSVARNVCLSYYRWSAVDRGSLFTLRQREDADAPVSPFDMTSARELERRVERALGQLSFEYREVLILTAIERLPQEEIARMLQLSPEAVRQRLSRARKLLTKALERAEDTSLERPVPDET
jgi:RNA polymerase sigma-70 factor (ECF subfamily)